jgi:hypothetical protein
MFVFLVIQNTKRVCRIMLPPVVCPDLPYFSTLSHKRYDFRGGIKMYQNIHKMYVLISSTTFVRNISYYTKKSVRYDHKYRAFIMFSVITNIYNKKTKGPTLMELFTATGKLENFFFTTVDVRCVHDGWHGTHRYDIQVLAKHASTWAHRYSSLLQSQIRLQWSVPLGERGHAAMVRWIPGLWHIPKEKNHRA